MEVVEYVIHLWYIKPMKITAKILQRGIIAFVFHGHTNFLTWPL